MTVKKYENIGWAFVALGTLFLIVTCIYFFKLTNVALPGKIDSNLTGAMGSFISGFVGVLFSLAAVLFFVVALKSQKEELILQRKEYALQREELALQRGELSETRAIFSLQQFEATFFNLLTSQQHIRQMIMSSGPSNFAVTAKKLGDLLDTSTVDQFRVLYNRYLANPSSYSIAPADFASFIWLTAELDLDDLNQHYQKAIYNKFFEENNHLGHYINNLCFLLKYLRDYDRSKGKENTADCQQYFNYVVAPMTRPELYILGQHAEANKAMDDVLNYFNWKERFDQDTGLMI